MSRASGRRASAIAAKRKKNRAPLLAITVGCVAGAAAMTYGVYRQDRIAHANQLTTCTVVQQKVGTSSSNRRHRYTPEVTLAHEVGGRRYQRTDSGDGVQDRNAALHQLQPYKVGVQVPCYYVAGSPDLVTVFRTAAGHGLLWFAGFLLLIPVFAFVVDRRRARS